jgi:hypothetical protein
LLQLDRFITKDIKMSPRWGCYHFLFLLIFTIITPPMGLKISIKRLRKQKAQRADILVTKALLTELKPQRGGI